MKGITAATQAIHTVDVNSAASGFARMGTGKASRTKQENKLQVDLADAAEDCFGQGTKIVQYQINAKCDF